MYPKGRYTLVSRARNPPRRAAVFYRRRYVVRRLHFRGDVYKEAPLSG